MALTFLKKLARSAPITVANSYHHRSKSSSGGFHIPAGAIAAISRGLSCFYFASSPNVAHLDQINEDTCSKIALNPDNGLNLNCKTQRGLATTLSYSDFHLIQMSS